MDLTLFTPEEAGII